MDRVGALAEAKAAIGDFQTLRVGGWYEHIERKKTRNWYETFSPLESQAYREEDLYSITQDRQYRSVTNMVYAQDKLSLLDDKLEIDLGATYQTFRETYQSPVEFYGVRALDVSSDILPKVAALYRLGDQWEFFASASKNFSALPDTVFEGTSAIDPNGGVKPETSVNKDAGVRWISRHFGAALTLFDIDYRDRISIQLGNPNGDIFSRDAKTTFVNQGGISSRGIELTGRVDFPRYELYGVYSFLDAHYVEDTPFEGIKAGDPVLGAARHSAFVEGTWKPDVSWRISANAKYVGKAAGTYGDVPNTVIAGGPPFYPREYMPAYTLVGLSTSYRFMASLFGHPSPSEIQFNVDNLFDKRYLSGIGMELVSGNPLTTGRYFLGSPRTFFISLRTHL
jgi:outer membrane receptor protein involved in Fe transport